MNSGRVQFPDIMSALEQEVNYRISSLFICIDYKLLNRDMFRSGFTHQEPYENSRAPPLQHEHETITHNTIRHCIITTTVITMAYVHEF